MIIIIVLMCALSCFFFTTVRYTHSTPQAYMTNRQTKTNKTNEKLAFTFYE